MAETPPPAAPAVASLPLAVDLDGTLIRSDVFADAVIRFVFGGPWNVVVLLRWIARGRAYAKARVAESAPFDPTTLPYDQRLLEWLKAERASGRRLVLATASDVRAAEPVAAHVDLFERVFASDGVTNLKSRAKGEALARAFPEGFVYAGNAGADLDVWARAARAVLVNASPGLAREVSGRFTVEHEFQPAGSRFAAFVKAIRVRQWAKNALVFLPMLAGMGWSRLEAWRAAGVAFLALSFAASSVYLVNDAADIDADRQHPSKRQRPFASGALSPVFGTGAAAALLLAAVALGFAASILPWVLSYVVLSTLYTFALKRKLLVDVFVLAVLYTLRVIAGGVATGFLASNWLLAFSCFFFLSLAMVKRATEIGLAAAKGEQRISRRGYRAGDGATISAMGIASGFVSSLVLALYIQGHMSMTHFAQPLFLWALPGLVVYWLCRVWMLAARGEMHDDPLVWALRDRVSWIVAAGVAIAFLMAARGPDTVFSRAISL